MQRLRTFVVDAFTTKRFEGNPAAVVPLDAWLPDATLAAIARENNLSETAFFVPEGDAFRLRWLTPKVEVDLCGHATLASAFVVLRHLEPARRDVTFLTRSGPLHVARDEDALAMDFPARPPETVDDEALLRAVGDALGKAPRALLRARDVVATFDHAADVRALAPDMAKLAALAGVFAVVATAPGDGEDADVDFVSRFFAPAKGVPEDPVTGSAHCTLAPHWCARLGKDVLEARQVGPRGGAMRCTLRGDRVSLRGHAVLVTEGTMYLDDEGARSGRSQS